MLFVLFIFLTVIHIPVLKAFKSGSFYEKEDGFIVRHSLGNLGFS